MMAPDLPVPDKGMRLAGLRRIYLYFVAFYSLAFLQISVRNAGQNLGFLWARRTGSLPLLSERAVTEILEQSSFALVAVLCFGVHWGLAQGCARRIPDERASFWRKLFLLLAVAVALYFSSAYAAELVQWPLLLIGQPFRFGAIAGSTVLVSGLSLILSGTILGHFIHVIYREREAGAYSRPVGILTGLWWVVVAAFALGLLLASTNEGVFFLQSAVFFRFASTSLESSSMAPWAEFVAVIVVSLGVLVYLQQFRYRMLQGQWLRQATGFHAAFLYLGLLTGSMLMAAGVIALATELGPGLVDRANLNPRGLRNPLSVAPVVGLGCWLWFRRELQRIADLHLAAPGGEFLWQTCHHILAALGLIWLARGCAGVMRYFLYVVTGATKEVSVPEGLSAAIIDPIYNLAASTGELLVALPLLWLAWRAMARHTPRYAEPDAWRLGIWPRRIYLYGVTLVATLSLLFLVGQALYEVLQALVLQSSRTLHDPWAAMEAGASLYDVLRVLVLDSFLRQALPWEWILIIAVIFLIHLRVLVRDRKAEEHRTGPSPHARTVLRRELAQLQDEEVRIQNRIAELQQALAALDETAMIPGEKTET